MRFSFAKKVYNFGLKCLAYFFMRFLQKKVEPLYLLPPLKDVAIGPIGPNNVKTNEQYKNKHFYYIFTAEVWVSSILWCLCFCSLFRVRRTVVLPWFRRSIRWSRSF